MDVKYSPCPLNISVGAKANVQDVVGTHDLLEGAREYFRVLSFNHVSPDEVYGGERKFEILESLPTLTNSYECTKAAPELIFPGYENSFRMRFYGDFTTRNLRTRGVWRRGGRGRFKGPDTRIRSSGQMELRAVKRHVRD